MNIDESGAQTKCSLAAIAGMTNSGKSTLINALVGFKASIVTHKVHTTRVRTNAILNIGEVQLIFTDTPGIFSPKTKLEKFLVKNAWSSIKGADVVILVVTGHNYLCDDVARIVQRIQKGNVPAVAVLNKIDLLKDCQASKVLEHLQAMHKFEKIFPISSLYSIGLEKLTEYLRNTACDSPWLYPSTQRTDATLEFFTSEITREKLFLALRQELPYSLAVVTEHIEEGAKGIVIKQVIYVVKESQKAIVVGKGASLIKSVCTAAREELSNMLDKEVHLYLFVKVRRFWQDHMEECVGYV